MLIIKQSIPFLLGAALLVTGCSSEETGTTNQEEKSIPTKQVETITVRQVDYSPRIFASGQLASKEQARLSFKTGGIIKKIAVQEGQSVRRGQLIAELALDEIAAQNQQAAIGQEQAELQVENAKLALQLAERDFKNAKGLYQDSVATLEQLENAEVQLENAKNQLQAAEKGLKFSKQNVEVASFNLEYSKIVAPSNGIILRKVAEVNELVGPGTPVVLFGSREKAQVIRVAVTDKDIIHIGLGDPAEVYFDAYPDEAFGGVVREIASMADPYTGTYEVEIEVKLEGKRLLNGFIGEVYIEGGNETSMLGVPVDALVSADEKEGIVFI
ncbi:MAG: efflux RND transporter periplasmic adaptor subunit, partial [Saprospiraceae bacterium]|nr:efflux RND transporter periplasmic adaptor subunit [Saprospiraceae bacterium]